LNELWLFLLHAGLNANLLVFGYWLKKYMVVV